MRVRVEQMDKEPLQQPAPDDIKAEKSSELEARETIESLPEAFEYREVTGESIARACGDTLSIEDCEELAAMPVEEAAGYAFTLLLDNGIEDPEEYLKGKGILE